MIEKIVKMLTYMWYLTILEESPYFSANLPIWNFKISLYNSYISSLFQISDLPIWNQEFSSLFHHSPNFEK